MLRALGPCSRAARLRLALSPGQYTARCFSNEFETPTTDVRSGHAFDEQKLVSYLQKDGVLSKEGANYEVKQFSNGQSNPTFILNDGSGSKLVVRKQPDGKLLAGAHAVDREYTVMQALQGTVPVPKVRGFCDDASVLGTPFFCYDYVEGRFFKDPAMLDLSCRAERSKIYENMIETLAKIHSVDVDKCGLGTYGKRVNAASPQTPYVVRQIKTWSRAYLATATEPIEDMDVLMGELAGLLPRYAEQESVSG
jgi:aminoglycoside phosphotransferase (APT) family kinase protein